MSSSPNDSFGTPPENLQDFSASDNLSPAQLKKILEEPFELEDVPDTANFNMFDMLTFPTEGQITESTGRFKQVTKEDIEKAKLATVAEKIKKQMQWGVNLLKCKQMII